MYKTVKTVFEYFCFPHRPRGRGDKRIRQVAKNTQQLMFFQKDREVIY